MKRQKRSQGNTGYWRHRRSLSVTNSLLISRSPPHLEKTCSPPFSLTHTHTTTTTNTSSLSHTHTHRTQILPTPTYTIPLFLSYTHTLCQTHTCTLIQAKKRNSPECLQPTRFPMCGKTYTLTHTHTHTVISHRGKIIFCLLIQSRLIFSASLAQPLSSLYACVTSPCRFVLTTLDFF